MQLQIRLLRRRRLRGFLLAGTVLSAVYYAGVVALRLFLFQHLWQELQVGRFLPWLLFVETFGAAALSLAVAAFLSGFDVLVVGLFASDEHEVVGPKRR